VLVGEGMHAGMLSVGDRLEVTGASSKLVLEVTSPRRPVTRTVL
jgi:hypothetical protein